MSPHRCLQVHRLDRDYSGILVMGRTQTSTTVLHFIFREKTSGELDNTGEENTTKKVLGSCPWFKGVGHRFTGIKPLYMCPVPKYHFNALIISSFLGTNYWGNIYIHHSVSEWIEMEGRVSRRKKKH
ncbi:hypothetical protein VNO80_08459 [Phaseolus coccineus]|uniref:Uncharacterized protein n=1 Tax=Phaseolus coccineus TaxID=3886 RepID=A0AAN9RHE5_PHACN